MKNKALFIASILAIVGGTFAGRTDAMPHSIEPAVPLNLSPGFPNPRPASSSDLERIIGPLPYVGPGISLPPGVELLTNDLPSLSVGRPMTVMIEPWRPGPSDEVTVEISGWSSVPYLEAGSVDVDIDGNLIVIDINWISNPPAPAGLDEAWAIGLSVGITHEEIPLPLAGNRGMGTYEITESLGTFSPGDYTVEVNSYGALTGTTTTTFAVYEASPGGPSLPDPWSLLHPDSELIFGFWGEIGGTD